VHGLLKISQFQLIPTNFFKKPELQYVIRVFIFQANWRQCIMAKKTLPATVQLLARTWHDFRSVLGRFILFDLIFKLLALTILAPLTAWVSHRLVRLSGDFAVGNEQILSFFLSPSGIAAALFAGVSTLALLFAEQAGFTLAASSLHTGNNSTYLQSLGRTLKLLPILYRLGLKQVLIYAACLLPFAAAAGGAYLALTHHYDINYLITEKPPLFWVGAALAALLGLGATLVSVRLFLGWIYSVPLCALAGENPAAALKKSRALAMGNRARMGTTLFIWIAMVSAGGAIAGVAIHSAGDFLLPRLGSNLTLLIPVASLFMVLFLLSMAVFGFVGFSGFCLATTRAYFQLTSGQIEHPSPVKINSDPIPLPARWVWVSVIGAVVLATAISFLTIESIDIEPRVRVTAHRGSSLNAPENTLAAVRRAIEDGADYAEIDVQETAGGEIVVIHDSDLVRIAGVPKKIWEITTEEIQSLDVGGWFSDDFKGEPLPTLDQMITLAGDDIRLNIELKLNGHEKELVERVTRIIREHAFQDRCLITSLSYDALIKTRQIDPDLKTGYIVFQAVGDLSRVDADAFSLGTSLVTARLVDNIQKQGKEVHVWTVNDPKRMRHFIELGVDNIITDKPDLLVVLIKERAELSDSEKLLLAFSSRIWG
jgi:glycerophosphoryl diester phosphodiesterase